MILMVILYIIVDIFCINNFLTQRAVLDLQRKYNLPMDFRQTVCPLSKLYRLRRVFSILSWLILIYIVYQYEWYYALIILVIDYLITSFIPVPASKYQWAKEMINAQASLIHD